MTFLSLMNAYLMIIYLLLCYSIVYSNEMLMRIAIENNGNNNKIITITMSIFE